MPYVITEACKDTKDKSCVDVCPVDCIVMVPAAQLIDRFAVALYRLGDFDEPCRIGCQPIYSFVCR